MTNRDDIENKIYEILEDTQNSGILTPEYSAQVNQLNMKLLSVVFNDYSVVSKLNPDQRIVSYLDLMSFFEIWMQGHEVDEESDEFNYKFRSLVTQMLLAYWNHNDEECSGV